MKNAGAKPVGGYRANFNCFIISLNMHAGALFGKDSDDSHARCFTLTFTDLHEQRKEIRSSLLIISILTVALYD